MNCRKTFGEHSKELFPVACARNFLLNSRCENSILYTYLPQNGCEIPKSDKLTNRKLLTK
jgi:hypothetical protein